MGVHKRAAMRRAATAAAVLVAVALLSPATGHAAEIKVLAFLSAKPILTPLVPEFEKASGHTLKIEYGSLEPLNVRIAAGEPADILVTSRALLDALVQQGKITNASVTDLARITIRLFVRAGSHKPDISTVDALRTTMLANTIAFTNPTRGALAGRAFAAALKQMGIYDQVLARAKVIQGLGDEVVAAVAAGEATIGAGPTNDVTPLPKGIDILGPLPKDLHSDVMISAGIPKNALEPDAATVLVRYLKGPVGAAAFARQGLEP